MFVELARHIGVHEGVGARYLNILHKEGLLRRDRRGYRLGTRVVDLGLATFSATSLEDHARPYMEHLAKHSCNTVILAVLDGPEILILEAIYGPGQRKTKTSIKAGDRRPAYCTSMGKLLLAHLADEPREMFISQMDLVAHTSNTITDPEELNDHLERVRLEGIAVDNEERTPGTYAIAAPVRDEAGDVVAAISILSRNWSSDLNGLVGPFRTDLLSTAARISGRLGCPPLDIVM
jgi:IclR family transcriptional regulator, pca regulon regulatory protein